MKVTLISHTPDALALLLFSKQTRLRMSGEGLEAMKALTLTEKMKELEYMRNTIKSSWEFIDYVFVIEDVTRAFTHQLVRHRVGTSFAQQAQRAVNMEGFTYETGPSIANDLRADGVYAGGMEDIRDAYEELLKIGANKQDARGILPTNICTNILFKANLRTLHDMGLTRLCTKAQGEFQQVFRKMRDAVIEVHPWAERFIRVWCAFHGTCTFPTFPVRDCHVKPFVYDPERQQSYGAEFGCGTVSLEEIQEIWERGFSEAQPEVPLGGPR